MLSRGELLLLRLFFFFTRFIRVILNPTDPQRVLAPDEGGEHAKEIKPPSPHPTLWFDYPDSDKEKILAVYKLIGEEPVFVPPSSFPQHLQFILVGSILLILLFFLYQICTKLIGKKGSA